MSCSNYDRYSRFDEIDLTNVECLNHVRNNAGVNILLGQVENQMKISKLIKEVKYIPLETTDNSLISFISMVEIYKNRIYVMDNIIQDKVYIFDIDGKFVKVIGQKGSGPEEYTMLFGMTIDRENNMLITYDNLRRRFMYYTLNGEFLRSVLTPFSFYGEMMVSSENYLLSVTNKSNRNTHLKELEEYRIIFTNSLGDVVKGAFKYDDNKNLSTAYSQLYRIGDELVFFPQYTNSIYTIHDSIISLRYRIDMSNYYPYDLADVINVRSRKEFDEIKASSTYLLPNMIETYDYLYFCVLNKNDHIYSFYNKKTGGIVSFKNIDYDGDCIFYPSISRMTAYNNYFVSSMSAEVLKSIKSIRDNSYNKLSDDVALMIDSLNCDDNNVLVLFKLNNL